MRCSKPKTTFVRIHPSGARRCVRRSSRLGAIASGCSKARGESVRTRDHFRRCANLCARAPHTRVFAYSHTRKHTHTQTHTLTPRRPPYTDHDPLGNFLNGTTGALSLVRTFEARTIDRYCARTPVRSEKRHFPPHTLISQTHTRTIIIIRRRSSSSLSSSSSRNICARVVHTHASHEITYWSFPVAWTGVVRRRSRRRGSSGNKPCACCSGPRSPLPPPILCDFCAKGARHTQAVSTKEEESQSPRERVRVMTIH